MWKKTFLALAAATTFVGVGAFFAAAPAEAQPYQRPPHHWGGGPGPRVYGDPPRNHWRHQPRWGYRSGWVAPPGVVGYGYRSYDECRTVMKRSRVWTDDGWRRIWRRVRVCD